MSLYLTKPKISLVTLGDLQDGQREDKYLPSDDINGCQSVIFCQT